jgi:DNA-binding transcriptional MerR regulator
MNAEQAARLLGVSAKTVHRHIAKGTITATYVHSQKRDIADDQVEKLRQVLASSHVSRHESDTSQTQSRQIEELTERLASAEQRIASLERELHNIAQSTKDRPVLPSTDETTKVPVKRPKIAPTEARESIPDELPSGRLSAVEFAQQIGIEYTVLEGILRHGISPGRGKEKVNLEVTEEDHPTRKGYKLKSFTPEQAKKAVDILKRHGKL